MTLESLVKDLHASTKVRRKSWELGEWTMLGVVDVNNIFNDWEIVDTRVYYFVDQDRWATAMEIGRENESKRTS